MKPNGGAKPNGVAKETMEPTEGAGAESSISQEQVIVEEVTEPASSTSQPEEAVNSTAAPTGQEAHGKSASAASDPKAKRKAPASKTKYGAIAGVSKTVGVSNPSSRPGTSPNRAVNGFKALNSSQASVTTVKTASSLIGAMPKMRVGAPAPSFNVSKSQTQMADKRTAEPVRKTSAAAATTVTNSSRPAAAKKQTAGPVNGTRPKTTAPVSKPSASTTQKPNPSAAARAERTAVHKTSRPATGSAAAQPASKPPSGSGGTGTTTKTMSSTAGTKPAASRFPTTSSAGRTTAAQISKTATTAAAAAKRSVGVLRTDVGRPAFTTAAKKPATAAPTKRPEPPKPATTSQRDTSFKRPASTKTVEPKLLQPKTKHAKDIPPKKEGRLPAMNKPSMGKPTPASQASKLTTSGTPQRKHPKQPQAVLTSTTTDKKAANSITAAEKPSAAAATVTVSTADIVELTKPAEAAAAYKEPEVISPTPEVSAQEEVPIPAFTQKIQAEVVLQKATLAAAPSPPSPVQTAIPPTSSSQSLLESTDPSGTTHVLTSAQFEEVITPVNHSPTPAGEPLHPTQHQAPSTSEAPSATPVLPPPKVNSPTNLNEEEDEEEREGSQQVSVSEMSGTTQLTEESRPGSAGPVGGAAWRAGGALFSELDSEEVSGSQQGASELSAPGVLEGTESIDDLGDASFKGAIDMEGASVGSPDFERVPDIPTTDFDEDDDEDDEDRVCDMDVGSERADDPCTPRHVNEVDDEDDDVEMASEGITESGLESYGNADEDDLAEDERLDNLNRVAQPPPPPPLLPSAPAAQWDQPNPFADPWAQPLVPQQPLVHLAQPVQPSAVAEGPISPSANLWQADFETQTRSAAQAWLQVDSAAFSLQIHDDSNSSSVQDEQPNSETQGSTDQPGIGSMQTLVLAASSAPPMSLSSTLSSDTSTPDDSCDPQLHIQETQAPLLSFKHYPKDQDLGFHLQMEGDGEREEGAEAEILPDNEVLGGPLTAPTSNPSSSSTTEDDASDVEGEAELEDPMEGHGITANLTFDSQPRNLRCLSAPEGEVEADGSLGGDATPLSANSMASYGFDSSMTTASNSNAQSTGESCTKSPGIFSLEELPEEAKDPSLIQELPAEPSLAEQHYMHCGKQDAEPAEDVGVEVSGSDAAPDVPLSRPEDDPNDLQPPYYSAICEKTENSFAGLSSALPYPHHRHHATHARPHCDTLRVTPPLLSCASLRPPSPGPQTPSPQLRRLEQHQRQLMELQQRREGPSGPTEEEKGEQGRRAEEQKKKEEEEEKLLRQEETEKQKRELLHLQLQQQQEELKQRQQIMQWQQELQQQQSSPKGQSVVLLSPSSGLCTIYEALENSEEEEEAGTKELKSPREGKRKQEKALGDQHGKVTSDADNKIKSSSSSSTASPPLPASPHTPTSGQLADISVPTRCGGSFTPASPPPELEWGKKVDIVQQLINQTLLLNGDGCSPLLLLPGGGGGTLSPLESSLWPTLLTPPSATVTSVSSFSPEAAGSSPQGEWTVVELETHH